MNKIISILLFFTIITEKSFSQDSCIKHRLNFKAGYARYNEGIWINGIRETFGNYRIEANYGFQKYIETGIYLGYSKIDFAELDQSDSSHFGDECKVPFYGINLNFHLLPFIIKKEDFRFDFYLTGKFGGLYFSTPDYYYHHGHKNEYGFGAGLSFYMTKHIGLYLEYCYGKYYFNDNMKLRYGLTLKF